MNKAVILSLQWFIHPPSNSIKDIFSSAPGEDCIWLPYLLQWKISKFVGSSRFLKINYSACWKLITYLQFVQKNKEGWICKPADFSTIYPSTK